MGSSRIVYASEIYGCCYVSCRKDILVGSSFGKDSGSDTRFMGVELVELDHKLDSRFSGKPPVRLSSTYGANLLHAGTFAYHLVTSIKNYLRLHIGETLLDYCVNIAAI